MNYACGDDMYMCNRTVYINKCCVRCPATFYTLTVNHHCTPLNLIGRLFALLVDQQLVMWLFICDHVVAVCGHID